MKKGWKYGLHVLPVLPAIDEERLEVRSARTSSLSSSIADEIQTFHEDQPERALLDVLQTVLGGA